MSEVYFVFACLWMSPFLCPIGVPAESLQVGNTFLWSDASLDSLSMRLDYAREYCLILSAFQSVATGCCRKLLRVISQDFRLWPMP